MPKKVLVSPSSFGKCGNMPIEILKENKYEIILNSYGRRLTEKETIKLGKHCVGIIAGVEPLNKKVLSSLKSLRCISRVGVGVRNIDLEYAKKQGIIIKNTPYGPTDAVAELTVGLIIDILRKISFRDRKMREGYWEKQMGQLLMNKKIGIVGLGRIGKKTAKILRSFDVVISAYDVKPDKKWAIENNVELLELDELLKNSDVISVHTPHSKDNKPIIGKDEIKNMSENCYLINVSRGGVIDEEALYNSLKNKEIAGAAVDVFSEEPYHGYLLNLDNVVLTPHIGSYAKEARLNMEIESVKNFIHSIKNGENKYRAKILQKKSREDDKFD